MRAIADVTTPADFENIIINGKTRLGDVARVVFGPQNSASGLHSDGKSGIGIGIIRAAQSNTVQISDGVYKAVAQLKQTLPKGVNIKVSSDDSIFISGALHEVERSLGLAVVIVIAVIFLFLMDWRATLVPAISMPVALVGSIAGIYIAGFSLNILTLLAIVLATGLVVDDSIVVLENIVRRRSMGAGPRAAAVLGTQEVFFAVIATSLTLIAVFVPISFLPGQTGRLFREFGFTLAMCVALSCVVALSLGPMLASRLLKEHDDKIHHNPLAATGRFLAGFYRRLLRLSLDTPLVVIVIAVLFAGSALFVFGSIRQELTPPEDRAAIMIRVSAPPTVSLDFTQTQMQKIEDLVQPLVKSGEVISTFSVSGFGSNTSSGFITLTLAPWDQRTRSQQAIAAQVNADAAIRARRAHADHPGQQPRHSRRRQRPAVRGRRQRLHRAGDDGAKDRRPDEPGPEVRPRGAQLHRDDAGAGRQRRSRQGLGARHRHQRPRHDAAGDDRRHADRPGLRRRSGLSGANGLDQRSRSTTRPISRAFSSRPRPAATSRCRRSPRSRKRRSRHS